MNGLLLIMITVAAAALCQLYVKWCDRITTTELVANRRRTRAATPSRDDEAAA